MFSSVGSSRSSGGEFIWEYSEESEEVKLLVLILKRNNKINHQNCTRTYKFAMLRNNFCNQF